jgi:MAF protein
MQPVIAMPRLILASTSSYRKELLQRLQLPFDTVAPWVNETRHPGEAPRDLVLRLAEAKARAVAVEHPDALIIGSDQVAVYDGDILGKPGTHERAAAQLRRASGRRVTFLTGLCLLNSATGYCQVDLARFRVYFRTLTDAQIESYLRREQPYHCAGSFKSEGLGIALFERMEGDDPTALIGLPLIRLVDMLGQAGMAVL